ncbi:hypothetical protein [Floridanema aerugineum]|uniref:Ribosomal protein L20 n=1 Tax=Floridaenema aerugineum BLCC-F46 TaxID=3153654 RepID=A0ABV4XCV6_9CYAN
MKVRSHLIKEKAIRKRTRYAIAFFGKQLVAAKERQVTNRQPLSHY